MIAPKGKFSGIGFVPSLVDLWLSCSFQDALSPKESLQSLKNG